MQAKSKEESILKLYDAIKILNDVKYFKNMNYWEYEIIKYMD